MFEGLSVLSKGVENLLVGDDFNLWILILEVL